MGWVYQNLSYDEQQTFVFSRTDLVSVAQEVAQKNRAAQVYVDVDDSDVLIGKWNPGTHSLYDVGNLNLPDAISVTTRRDAFANGPVSTIFASIFGVNTLDVVATATAALTGESTAGPGDIYIPVGISQAWFQPNSCNQVIKFSPTGTLLGCAGWNTFTDLKVNDSELRTVLEGLTDGRLESPEITVGTTKFNFIGGTLSNQTFNAFKILFDAMKGKNDGVMDMDKDPATWTTIVPVYQSSDCSNPNEPTVIVGFATATIYSVQGPPAKTIFATVVCNSVNAGRGSGRDFGTKGSIPGLVR